MTYRSSVSVCAPVFYADLAALKARALLQDLSDDDNSSVGSAWGAGQPLNPEGALPNAGEGEGEGVDHGGHMTVLARPCRFAEINKLIAVRGMFFV